MTDIYITHAAKLTIFLKNNNFPDALMSKTIFYVGLVIKIKKSNLIFSNAKGLEWRSSKIWFDKFMNGFIDIAERSIQEVLFHTN